MKRAIAYINALSPLHAGTGQALDIVDLPIARERATDLPYIPGSSIKGVMRAEASIRNWDEGLISTAFGPEWKNASEFAGAVTISDARLLLFPVRSASLLFAWVTSPYLLRRFFAERKNAGLPDIIPNGTIPALPTQDQALISHNDIKADGNKVFLEDADLDATLNSTLTLLASVLGGMILGQHASLLQERLVLVSDTQLGFFVRQATEVVARIALEEESKTVKKGGLWYEEALPTESILYAPIIVENGRNPKLSFSSANQMDKLKEISSLQIGGKATVGRGLCRLVWE